MLRWRRWWGPELSLLWPKLLRRLADRRRLVDLLRLTSLLGLPRLTELRGIVSMLRVATPGVEVRLLGLARGTTLVVMVATVTLRYRCGLGSKRVL